MRCRSARRCSPSGRACPWATVAVIPLNLVGAQGPPSGMGLAPGRNPVDESAGRGAPGRRPPVRPLACRDRSLVREQTIGLPPSKLTFDRVVFSPRLVIASGSPLLDYDRTDRPSSLHFVGQLQSSPGAGRAPRVVGRSGRAERRARDAGHAEHRPRRPDRARARGSRRTRRDRRRRHGRPRSRRASLPGAVERRGSPGSCPTPTCSPESTWW